MKIDCWEGDEHAAHACWDADADADLAVSVFDLTEPPDPPVAPPGR